jgi:hypothetical protein
MKHRPSRHRFLAVAGGTFIHPRPRFEPPSLPSAAHGANKPAGPAQLCQVLDAPPVCSKPSRQTPKAPSSDPLSPTGAMLL